MADEKTEEKIQKKEGKKEGPKKPEPKLSTKKFLRIANTDIDSSLRVRYALKRIKGVGYSFANAVCINTGIDPGKKAENLTPEEIRTIESFLKDPKLLPWMLNRRRDPRTGTDIHRSGDELKVSLMNDINFLKSIRAYRGIRHELGLPVRGQRTRAGGRKGRSVGVMKKAVQPAAAPKAAVPAAAQASGAKPAAAAKPAAQAAPAAAPAKK